MIIDTDVLVWYLRGHLGAAEFLEAIPFQERCTSVVVWMELVQGARHRDEVRTIRRFLSENFARSHPLSERISTRALALMEEYAPSHGLRLADALVAATAIEESESLATANVRHFKPLPGLRLAPFDQREES